MKDTDSEKIFFKNIELWSRTDPKQALMLPLYTGGDLEWLSKTSQEEASVWFSGLDLRKTHVLYVYGVGLGYYYDAAKAWLKKNKKRRLVFLEDDLGVIRRLFETERGTRLLEDPQTQLLYFKNLTTDEAIFEVLYWNFAMTYVVVSALDYYAEVKAELYSLLRHKIAYDSAVKNALVDEYLRYGGAFFINFYQNMLSLPGSSLGNKTFGSFRKVPAIICGAGPSLSKNLSLLSKLSDKALIFAGGSALNALNVAGIQPHLGAGIDPNPAQFDRLSTNTAFEVPFYYRNRMHHDAFEMIHGPRLYITGTGGYDIADYFEEKLKIHDEFLDEGHNVINFCLQIAHQLGCDPIIFVGMDLAFTGMKSYAPGVEDNIEFDPDKFGDVDEFDEKPLLLKDIYDKPLYTLWKWVAESDWISNFAKEHPHVTIINATEGGLGFKDVPNETLKEVIERYLTRNYAMKDRLNGEIQNSAMPKVTLRKVETLMKELRESLVRCIGYFKILIEETEAAKKEPNAGHALSGRAALCETDLAEEPGYKYVLEIFNEVQVRLYNRELHEIKELPERRKNLRKLEINLKRLAFLRDVAKVNVGMIDLALEKRKAGKRKKVKAEKGKQDTRLPEAPFKGFHPLLIPPDSVEGTKGPEGRIVTMRREYGKPPEEIRLENRGELDGQCLLYYPNGSLKAEVHYKTGELHGPSIYYSEKGAVLSKSWFEKGKQQGECKWYYPKGTLYCIQRYKDGLWHGKQEYYYEDGTPKTLMHYKNGQLEGKVLTYYPEGQLKRETDFTTELCNGR